MFARLYALFRTRQAMARVPGAETMTWAQQWVTLEAGRQVDAVAEATGSRAVVGRPEALDTLDDFVRPAPAAPTKEGEAPAPSFEDAPAAFRRHMDEMHLLAYGLFRFILYLGAYGLFFFRAPIDQWAALVLGCTLYITMTHAHRGVIEVVTDYTPRLLTRATLLAFMAGGFWIVVNATWIGWAAFLALDNLALWAQEVGIWHRFGTDPATFLAFFNAYWSTTYPAFTDAAFEATFRNVMRPLSPWHTQMYLFFEQVFRLLINPLRGWDEVAYAVTASQTPTDLGWLMFGAVDETITLLAFALAKTLLNGPFLVADTLLWGLQWTGLAGAWVTYVLPVVNGWAVAGMGVDLVEAGWVKPDLLVNGWIKGPVTAPSYDLLPP